MVIPGRVGGTQSLRNASASWNTIFASHQSTKKSTSQEGMFGFKAASQSETGGCLPCFLLWLFQLRWGLWDQALDLLNS